MYIAQLHELKDANSKCGHHQRQKMFHSAVPSGSMMSSIDAVVNATTKASCRRECRAWSRRFSSKAYHQHRLVVRFNHSHVHPFFGIRTRNLQRLLNVQWKLLLRIFRFDQFLQKVAITNLSRRLSKIGKHCGHCHVRWRFVSQELVQGSAGASYGLGLGTFHRGLCVGTGEGWLNGLRQVALNSIANRFQISSITQANIHDNGSRSLYRDLLAASQTSWLFLLLLCRKVQYYRITNAEKCIRCIGGRGGRSQARWLWGCCTGWFLIVLVSETRRIIQYRDVGGITRRRTRRLALGAGYFGIDAGNIQRAANGLLGWRSRWSTGWLVARWLLTRSPTRHLALRVNSNHRRLVAWNGTWKLARRETWHDAGLVASTDRRLAAWKNTWCHAGKIAWRLAGSQTWRDTGTWGINCETWENNVHSCFIPIQQWHCYGKSLPTVAVEVADCIRLATIQWCKWHWNVGFHRCIFGHDHNLVDSFLSPRVDSFGTVEVDVVVRRTGTLLDLKQRLVISGTVVNHSRKLDGIRGVGGWGRNGFCFGSVPSKLPAFCSTIDWEIHHEVRSEKDDSKSHFAEERCKLQHLLETHLGLVGIPIDVAHLKEGKEGWETQRDGILNRMIVNTHRSTFVTIFVITIRRMPHVVVVAIEDKDDQKCWTNPDDHINLHRISQ